MVTAIEIGGVLGLVLATDKAGCLNGQTPEHLAIGIKYVPMLYNGTLFGDIRLHV
jgi:hypothetical protein